MSEKNRKVIVLLRDFSGGGAERSMINISNGLAAVGVPVTLVLFSDHGPFKKYVSGEVEIVSLDTAILGLNVFSAIPSMTSYLKQVRPHTIISTLEATTIVAFFSLLLFSGRTKPNLLIRVATTFSNDIRTKIRDKLIRFVYKNHKGMFVTNSNGGAEDLEKTLEISKERIGVIYNGVDLDAVSDMAKIPLNNPRFFEPNCRYILNIGRLTQAKRQDILIRAFAKLDKAKQSNLRLLILGEGPLREPLETLVNELDLEGRVLMPGFVENPYQYLNQASLFVLSSEYEGMPTVLIEALACGRPVVSTNCPAGPAEILENGRWGELVPVNDPPRLAVSMEKTLGMPMDRNLLVERASKFSIDVMAEAYQAALFGGTNDS